MIDPNPAPTTLARPRSPERRMRVYLFAVIGTAVFLIALGLGLKPTSHEPPQAVLTRDGHGLAFGDLAARELASDERLKRAVESHRGTSPSEVAGDLRIVQEPAREGHQARLTITYRGSAAHGSDVINALVDSYVEEHSTRAERAARLRHSQAEQTLDAAQRSAASAQRQLDKFRRAHPELLSEPVVESPIAAAQPESQALNPAWAVAQEIQRRLAADRESLLARVTPVHPQVMQIEEQLAEATQRLAGLPQYLPAARQANPSGNTDELPAVGRLIERGKLMATL